MEAEAARLNAIPATTRHDTSSDAGEDTGNRLPEAFEQLFIAEYPRVVAIANRVLANRHEAEEVAQEVFLSFHRGHDPKAPYARPWLYRAASHSALNVLRGNKRRVVREVAGALPADAVSEDPHGIVEQQEQRQMVRQAMRRLPAKSASVLALRYSGLSYAEVAGTMGFQSARLGPCCGEPKPDCARRSPMRHLNDGTLRRMQDEPLSTTGAEKDHYASCAACRERAMAIATEAERAAMLMALPDPEVETQAALSRLRRTAAGQAAFKPGPWTSLKGLFVSGSNHSVRPVAALALAMAAMVALVATGAADNFVKVFEPQQFQAVQVRPDSLRGLPDLSQFGDMKFTSTPTFTTVADAAAAHAKTGLNVITPDSGSVPGRVGTNRSYVVMGPLQASFTFSAAKAQAWAKTHGKTLPATPSGLDGSTLTVTAGPAVIVAYGGSTNAINQAVGVDGANSGSGGFDPASLRLPDVAVVEMKSPQVSSSGASVQQIENYLISLPGFPPDLAAQIRAIGDPATTLPVPVPTGQQSHQVDVQGVRGLFVGDSTGLGSGMIWSKGGVLYATVGTMTESELTGVARSLH